MNQQKRSIIPDRAWQWLVLLASGSFLVLFFVPQAGGLASMGSLLWDALKSFPGFVADIIDYYKTVPGEQLWPSMLVGAVFGALSTAVVYLSGNTFNLARFTERTTLAVVFVGAFAGGIGTQILLYPAQHCTYASDIDGAQFRLGLLVTALSALILLAPLWALVRRRKSPHQTNTHLPGQYRSYTLPYLFLVPTLVFLGVFLYYPAIQITLVSLRRKIFPLPQEQFACLENYVSLTKDTVYRNSFSTTLFITFFVVLFSLSISLAIAVLASQNIKGASMYRTFLVWPYAISPVVTGVIFLSLFREGGVGLLNYGLDKTLGISPHWLTEKNLAPWVIVAAAVWNLLGFNILFYIAGLQNIPADLLEAASLDGAGRIRRFWRITFPLLSPFTFFLLITNITYSFYGIYGVVDTLTPEGGPRFGPGGESGATNVLIFKLYKDAFDTGAPAGLGSAQAVILFLMVATLTIVQFRFIERRVIYEG